LAIADLDFAAYGDDGGAALDGEAFETVVVVVGVLRFDGDGAAIGGIVDDEVGVAADRDGAFAGKKAEKLGGAGAGAIDETFEIDAAALDAVGVEKIDAIFDARNAVGNGGEVVFAEKFLLEIEGAVVGADSIDEAERERGPERVLIVFGAKRRRHDVLHAFDAGTFSKGFFEEQVGENGFDAESDAAPASCECYTQSFFAGKVDDVANGASVFEKGGEMAGAFGLDGFGAAGFVPFGTDFAFGEELLLEPGNEFGVFAVRGDDDAKFFRESESLKHFGIVDTEEILVGQENFEGGGTIGDDFTELRFRFSDEFRDGHVEGVVAGGVAGGFGLPELIAGERVLVAIWAAHFDVRGSAAEERGDAGGFVSVFGEGGHEREIDVDVGIDEAGEDELAGGVDDFGVEGHVEIFADTSDGFVFGVNVGSNAGAGGDDFAVADKERHGD